MAKKFPYHVLVYFIFFVFSSMVYGDVGPKPSILFFVSYDGHDLSGEVFHAELFSCSSGDVLLPDDLVPELNLSVFDSGRNCSWRPERFAWGGECSDSRCVFTYVIPEEFRLGVYLPKEKKVFLSDVVQRRGFHSTYSVVLRDDGSMEVTEMEEDGFRLFFLFFVALALTLLLELSVALVFVVSTRSSLSLLFFVAAANLLSLPFVWLLFLLNPESFGVIIFSLIESFAFVFEALFLYFLRQLSLKKAFYLSFFMNAVSFIVGTFFMLR